MYLSYNPFYSVTCIKENTFNSCSSLESITIPDSVTIIEEWAFNDCSSLKSIAIPDRVTSIGYYVFSGCPIETATIPAFACKYINRPLLKTVVITSGESIEYRAFYNCNSLTSINFSGTKEQWNAIEKMFCWITKTGDFTVHCIDGDIAK